MLVRSLGFLVLLSGFLGLAGCSSAPGWPVQPGQKRIVVSFPPLYSFVKNVAGDRADIRSLCTTLGPHEYTYTPGDASKVRQADVLFALGFQFDDRFVDQAVLNSGNEKLKNHVVKLGERIKQKVDAGQLPKDTILFGICNHPEHQGKGHPDDIDPHMWSGIAQAKEMVNIIRDTLKEIDPEGAETYDKNAKEYRDELSRLQTDGYKDLQYLKDKQNNKLVTFHASMAYFARSFNLEVVDSIRKVPTDDPTQKEFRDLVKNCRDQGVGFIAVEPAYPKTGSVHKLEEELKKAGIPVRMVELDPLETAKEGDLSAKWYVETMRKNIDALKEPAKEKDKEGK